MHMMIMMINVNDSIMYYAFIIQQSCVYVSVLLCLTIPNFESHNLAMCSIQECSMQGEVIHFPHGFLNDSDTRLSGLFFGHPRDSFMTVSVKQVGQVLVSKYTKEYFVCVT